VKRYRVRYTTEAAGRIRNLHPQIKKEIREGIRILLQTPLAGHPLHFELSGLRSYRIRNHRVIYRINADDRTIDVVFVGPRRDVYEQLRDLLLGEGWGG
jgi:mRNA-degrading endonuclease RelE of RelBE toxin-antitoxin system